MTRFFEGLQTLTPHKTTTNMELWLQDRFSLEKTPFPGGIFRFQPLNLPVLWMLRQDSSAIRGDVFKGFIQTSDID